MNNKGQVSIFTLNVHAPSASLRSCWFLNPHQTRVQVFPSSYWGRNGEDEGSGTDSSCSSQVQNRLQTLHVPGSRCGGALSLISFIFPQWHIKVSSKQGETPEGGGMNMNDTCERRCWSSRVRRIISHPRWRTQADNYDALLQTRWRSAQRRERSHGGVYGWMFFSSNRTPTGLWFKIRKWVWGNVRNVFKLQKL